MVRRVNGTSVIAYFRARSGRLAGVAAITFSSRPTGIGRARLGRLQTPHGAVDTPQFMPVGTQASVKSLTPTDLRTAGTQILLANTYHLSLRPGHERIARLGGLHRFMGWDGPILTDSGGFQVFSLAHLSRVDDDGVTFASHLDGSSQRLTPERAIEIQEALGSDIAMAFDQLVDATLPAREVARAMSAPTAGRNAAWPPARRPDQALFGIVQGGVDAALRRQSAAAIAGMPFDGIAIGGLSVGESKAEMAATLEVVAEALGDDPRVRYLMGVGAPPDFFAAVERGIDLFDCVLPTRVARNGQLWTQRAASSTCATRASWTTPARSTRSAAARRAATTRAPTSRTCSGRRSCSRIGSPRSITSPILST